MTDSTVTESGTTTTTFGGKIETAYGKELTTPLSYEASYEHANDYKSVPESEKPSEEDLLNLVNETRKKNARSAAVKKTLDDAGIKAPTLETDSDLQVKTIVKGLLASKRYTEEQATTMARQMLGLS